ncbi:MAG: glycoside hydrolase family 65 protein [Inquilinus sp.]|nr:glycoside hydrolase family 65 protein [Inquilinus sp.]
MSDWTLAYDGFESEQQALREALCALGNGYFCTRGALPWANADDVHYPGTYLAGGYNRLTTTIAGRGIENEDLVNLPNWLGLSFRPDREDWFNLRAAELLDYRQELDLREGVLTIAMKVRDRKDRTTGLRLRRIVSMASPHLAAQELILTPENWSGPLEIGSRLDGRVINAGVKRYRELNSSHLSPLEATDFAGPDGRRLLALVVETVQSRLRIGLAARTTVADGGPADAADTETEAADGLINQIIRVDAREGQPVAVEKTVALYTSRDTAISEPGLAAREAVAAAAGFATLARDHQRAWRRLWARCDIQLTDGDSHVQRILRLHIFHLLQTLSPNSIDLDIGVPARGWHGEAYRGHVFWDELFVLPFVNLRLPALGRAMLRYRFNRLPKARELARAAGFAGAMFPWQSGSDGREEAQIVHLNPRSGRWLPDNSSLQRHANLAIAFNTWNYFQATGDTGFLEVYGAEMIVEIARLFAALSDHDARRDRYLIRRVMGPDEYHDAYPDSEEAGIDNNAYTNVMAAWLMATALGALDALDDQHRRELMAKLDISERETEQWEEMSRKMFVPFHDDGIISQFEGYERLEEFRWDAYREKYGDIQRLDRILEAEGDTTNRYKLSKQADVLMLFYLFSLPELAGILDRLGYEFSEARWQANLDYYLARTCHGSTLSYIVHSWVLARTRPIDSWEVFRKALDSDVADVQGGTTPEGIHLGAMAGTVDLVQRCLTGLTIHGGALHFNPVLPEALRQVALKIRYHRNWMNITVTQDQLSIAVDAGWAEPAPVRVRGKAHLLSPGKSYDFPLNPQ